MSQMGSLYTGGAGGGTMKSLTGNTGGAITPDGVGNINLVGSGSITVAGNLGSNTLTISSTGGVVWNEITATTASMAINNGYIANNAALVTLTLPATAAQGSTINVAGKGAGLWKIAQNSGQVVHFGASNTTTGVGGYLASTLQYDCVSLVCVTANTDWVVMSSVGNITIV